MERMRVAHLTSKGCDNVISDVSGFGEVSNRWQELKAKIAPHFPLNPEVNLSLLHEEIQELQDNICWK